MQRLLSQIPEIVAELAINFAPRTRKEDFDPPLLFDDPIDDTVPLETKRAKTFEFLLKRLSFHRSGGELLDGLAQGRLKGRLKMTKQVPSRRRIDDLVDSHFPQTSR